MTSGERVAFGQDFLEGILKLALMAYVHDEEGEIDVSFTLKSSGSIAGLIL